MTKIPAKTNTRTLAQQGSQWQLTQDIPIYGLKASAQYPYGLKDWDVLATIAAGEKVSIASKKTTTYATQNGQDFAYDGLWIYLKRESDQKVWCVQFSDFNKKPTMLSVPEVIPFFVLRDTSTGMWYGDYVYRWSRKSDDNTNGLIYVDKLPKARKFKRLADARAHMLIISGYYEGLPDTGSLPEWMQGGGDVEWPATIEIVEIDKVTKNEVRTLETAEHQSKMWRLRELTLKFGSSVRAMYKKLEDKNHLGEYPVMVVWRTKDDNRYWDYEMEQMDVDAIKSIAKSMPSGQTVFIKTPTNACVACTNEGAAWAATQFYQGTLSSHVISLATLLESVPTNTSTLQTKTREAPETLNLPDLDLF